MAVSRQRSRNGHQASRTSVYNSAVWILLLFWLAVCAFTLSYNGPSPDEGLSITSGLRALRGYGTSDGYLSWIEGTLLWPRLAASGYQLAGLVGSRFIALLLAAVAVLAVAHGTADLFNDRASFWAAVSLSISGTFLTLARLAVFETLALSAIAVAFWCITRLAVTGDRTWVALAAGSYLIALLSKYTAGLAIIPLLWLMITLRGREARVDLGIFVFLSFALAVTLFLPNRERFAALPPRSTSVSQGFARVGKVIALSVYLGGIPLIIGSAGLLTLPERRRVVTALLGSLAVWPIYHLVGGNSEELSHQLAFASPFAYPVVGAVLGRFTSGDGREIRLRYVAVGLHLVLMAGLGLIQVNDLSQTWPDIRSTATFLVNRAEPGQRLYVDPAWPFAMYLYGEGAIDSPWTIVDSYRAPDADSIDALCSYDYFVEVGSYSGWSEQMTTRAQQCPGASEVYRTQDRAVTFGSSLRHIGYPVDISVWSTRGQ